jgi:hypothetical protein
MCSPEVLHQVMPSDEDNQSLERRARASAEAIQICT